MAAASSDNLMGTVTIPVLVEEAKNPDTTHDNPHKEEQRDQALHAAAGFLPIVHFIALLVLTGNLLTHTTAYALDDIDQCGQKAEAAEDDKPDRDTSVTRTPIQVDRTYIQGNEEEINTQYSCQNMPYWITGKYLCTEA